MKKRFGSLFMVLVLLGTMVLTSACGGAAASSSTPAAAGSSSGTASSSAASSAAATTGGDTLKIAMVCSGAINDGSWSNDGYNALMALKDSHGAEVTYSEQVSIDEVPTVLRTYGREGYDIVFAHSMEYDEQMKRVAPEFPETNFVTVNGFNTGDNLYSVQFKYWELQYFMGMAAALASKTGKVAVIHAMDTPMVALERQAHEQGATFVNPDATVEYSFTGDWNDQAKAKEASLAQLDNGADVLLANVSSCTQVILDACKEKNAYGMGWGNDVSAMAPDVVVISGLFAMNDLYSITVDKLIEDTDERELLLTMRDGAMDVTNLASFIPDESKKIFEDRLQEYLDGGFEIEVEGNM